MLPSDAAFLQADPGGMQHGVMQSKGLLESESLEWEPCSIAVTYLPT